jgi:hypothetical protein
MKPLLATAVALAMLASAAPGAAQTGQPPPQTPPSSDPFGPLAPQAPPAPPEEQEPVQPVEEDDGELGLTASLALAGITALIIGAVFVAITREGRRMDRRKARAHRQRKGRRSARPADLHRQSTGSSRTDGMGERRSQAKRPPPPPRKRRPKAKRR